MAESDDKASREYERRIREIEKRIQEQQEEERKKAIRDTFKPPKPKPDDEDD